MRRLLNSLTRMDWLVVAGGLLLVGVIELDKLRVPQPGAVPEEAVLRPSSEFEPSIAQPERRDSREAAREPQAAPKPPFARPSASQDPLVALRMANPPAMFESPSTLRLRREMSEFSPKMQAFLTDMLQKKRYFGSVALGPSGAYGWSADIAGLREAQALALAYCAQNGPDCEIVADLVPEALPEVAPRDSLSFVQSMALKGLQGQSGPRAFARSMDGSFGVGRETLPEEAERKAMTACTALQKPLPGLAPMPCEIIAFWGE